MEAYKHWAESHLPSWETDNLVGDMLGWPKDYEGLYAKGLKKDAKNKPVKTEEWEKELEALPAINNHLYMGVLEPNVEPAGIVHIKLWKDSVKQIKSFIRSLLKSEKERLIREILSLKPLPEIGRKLQKHQITGNPGIF